MAQDPDGKVGKPTSVAVYTRTKLSVKGTIRWVHVILNHRLMKSRFNSRPRGSERI